MPQEFETAVSPETLLELETAYQKQEEYRRQIAQPISIAVTAFLPSLLVELSNKYGFFNLKTLEWLEIGLADSLSSRMRYVKELSQDCLAAKTAWQAANKTLIEELCPQYFVHGSAQGLTSQFMSTAGTSRKALTSLTTLQKIKDLIDKGGKLTTPAACAKLAEQIGQLLPDSKPYLIHLRHGFKNLIAALGPFVTPEQFPHEVTSETKATQMMQWHEKIFKPGFDEHCNLNWEKVPEKYLAPRAQELRRYHNMVITMLLSIISLLIKKLLGDVIFARFLPGVPRPIPAPSTILTEEAAQKALAAYRENSEQLQRQAERVTTILRTIAVPCLFIFIYLLFFSDYIPADWATFISSIFIGASQNLLGDTLSWHQKRQWVGFIEQLQSTFRKMLRPLTTEQHVYDADDAKACCIHILVKNAKHLKLARAEQVHCLTETLNQLHISFQVHRGYCIIFENVKNLTADKLTKIQLILSARVSRQEQLKILDRDLGSLESYLDFQVLPQVDSEQLPIIECQFYNLKDEQKTFLKEIFIGMNINTDAGFIMTGFQPGIEDKLETFIYHLNKKEETKSKTKLDVSDETDQPLPKANSPSPLRERRPKTEKLIDEPVTVAGVLPIKQITIQWPSGKTYNSRAAIARDYRDQAGAVIPISSNHLAPNSHFICFDLAPPDFDTVDEFKSFLAKYKEARLMPRQGSQGLVFCNEKRNCNKYTWQQEPTGRWTAVARERIHYEAKVKIKLLGKHGGDMRCYASAEKAANGAMLYHIIEFEPDAH